jgi:pSer/pThr/pTyr-binding forkhead associated (FHA) protein
VHCEEGAARVLDDRSLNGVFLNGDRIDWHELRDGDEIAIGAFRLFYIRSTDTAADHRERLGSAVG